MDKYSLGFIILVIFTKYKTFTVRIKHNMYTRPRKTKTDYQNRCRSVGLVPFIQAYPCQTNIDLKFRQAKSSSSYRIRQFNNNYT